LRTGGEDVDDYLFTEDIGVSSAQTRDDLAAMLRVVHVRADRPSLRMLEVRTRHYPTPLSKTVVSEMLKGARFPRKAVMLSFLRACGVPGEETEPWRRAWERVAAREQGITSHLVTTGRGSEPEPALLQHGQGAPGAPAGDLMEPPRPDYELSADVIAPLEVELAKPPHVAGPQVQAKAAPGPLVRRRELSALLRQLRNNAGLTIEQVAERLLCSPSKVSRMETGFRTGTMRDIRDLCDVYGMTNHAQRDYLMELARESRRLGWWQAYDVPYGTYIGLESDAISISVFHPTVIPGILQTADYARAIMAAGSLSPEAAEQHVAVRLRRQELLDQDNAPELHVVVDEAALRRRVGGPSVMRAQLDYIIGKSGLPNISVQVIPYAHGAYEAMDSNFSILEFPNQMAGIVHVEGVFGFLYLEREQDLQHHKEAFLDAQSAAIDDGNSIELITAISGNMT
jgi:transcriptional regulator with XRE-family HTH domain